MIGGAAKVVPVDNALLDFLALTSDELDAIERKDAVSFVQSLRQRRPMQLVDAATLWNSLRVGFGFHD